MTHGGLWVLVDSCCDSVGKGCARRSGKVLKYALTMWRAGFNDKEEVTELA